jgi:hypothetical protein
VYSGVFSSMHGRFELVRGSLTRAMALDACVVVAALGVIPWLAAFGLVG